VLYTYNGVIFSHKEEGNYYICKEMDETGDYCIKQNKKDKTTCFLSYIEDRLKNKRT
jgi:hypothetical protein